jgi:hypothetical protein
MAESVVCIFPHSNDEFRTPDDLRTFLSSTLPAEPDPGRYLLGTLGWRDKNFKESINPDSLVLFSKKGLIVGKAISKTMIKELEPPEESETETGAKATYYHEIFFVPESIKVCKEALSVELIERWAGMKHNIRSYRILGLRRDFEKAFPNC